METGRKWAEQCRGSSSLAPLKCQKIELQQSQEREGTEEEFAARGLRSSRRGDKGGNDGSSTSRDSHSWTRLEAPLSRGRPRSEEEAPGQSPNSLFDFSAEGRDRKAAFLNPHGRPGLFRREDLLCGRPFVVSLWHRSDHRQRH